MDDASLAKLARLIRYYILTITTAAGSGHPTSSLSAVELMTGLFFKYLRYDLNDPKNALNDRVIFSKGHASPLYYALYAAAGAISAEDLMKYRTFDSVLEGHPTERFKYTEAATGSLGQGLSIGVGEALGLRLQHQASGIKRQEKKNMTPDTLTPDTTQMPRVFVLSGDGELAEGSVWEAAAAASKYTIGNLTLIADINALGQSDPTMYGHDLSVYQKRFESFGWKAIIVNDGHDVKAVDRALGEAVKTTDQPTVILAKTLKGKGVSFVENKDGWHGKPLSKEELDKALAELGAVDKKFRGVVAKPMGPMTTYFDNMVKPEMFSYPVDKPVATRKAFGNALKRLGNDTRLVVLDGDVKNSTYTEFFGKAYPDRFFELFIAEQNMAGAAVGLSARGFHPAVASFAAFWTRAADQIRMAAFSRANIVFNGSHAGVSIGPDGPSQMGLEDLAMFRAVHGSIVLYPADAVSTERLTEDALSARGIVYIRTGRPDQPILYSEADTFPVGGSKEFRVQSPEVRKKEVVAVVAAGVTLNEALKAQSELAKENIGIRVIDCYSVKPIDEKTLVKAAKETKAIIIVEDHYPEGGLGEAVKSALAGVGTPIVHLAVRKTPRSGKPAELLAYEEIDSAAIVSVVKSIK